MLTRRNVLKRFASTVVAGGIALLGLRPAKASPAFRPVKSVEGVVTSIRRSGSSLQHFDFDFGSHKACMTAEHAVTIIRNGRRAILPVRFVWLGDTLCVPKYLIDPWVREAMMNPLVVMPSGPSWL